MLLLKVVLPLPLEPMSYLPPHGDTRLALGCRVVVPWRGELRVGLVVAVEQDERKGFSLREAVAYLDPEPWLRPVDVEFLYLAAREHFCSLGVMVDDLLPFLEPPLHHRVRLLPSASPSVLPAGLESLAQDWQEAHGFDPKLLDYLREGGVLEEEVAEQRPERKVLIPIKPADEQLTPKGKAALELLAELGESESMAALARQAGVGTGVIKKLLDKGYVSWKEIELTRTHTPTPSHPLQPLPLPEIPSRINGGKLQERLRLLTTLVQDGPALVLFPEVSLLKRYQSHFPNAIAFHGEMSPELRRQEFGKIGKEERGKRKEERGLNLPPSSFLFPPMFATYQGLSLPITPSRIIVVEESAEAYKLSAGSRANAVRLAELKAKHLGIPITYLSLVSSVEMIEQEGLSFPVPEPRLHLLNLADERGWPITGAAIAVLRQVEEKHRQAVVLVNRRGYSAVLRCKQCDWKAMCPNCSVPLRFHKGSSRLVTGGHSGSLVCHQCGHEEGAPKLCPKCQSDVFEPRGPGVEWVLDALKEHLPGLPRYRYSADAKDDLTPLLQGEPGVLVGTTAVLRGPVLPELAVILLPYADGFVLDSDFRAEERYHRFLWQLTELHPGRRPLLVLQTFEPTHAAHRALQASDVEGRVRDELKLRRLLNYPPALRMLKLEVSHAKEPAARDAAIQVANYLNAKAGAHELLGPAPAPMHRVKAQFIFHLLLRGSTERLRELMQGLPHPRGARLRIDPDPQSFVGLLED